MAIQNQQLEDLEGLRLKMNFLAPKEELPGLRIEHRVFEANPITTPASRIA